MRRFEKHDVDVKVIGLPTKQELQKSAEAITWDDRFDSQFASVEKVLETLMRNNGLMGGSSEKGRGLQVNVCVQAVGSILRHNDDCGIGEDTLEKFMIKIPSGFQLNANAHFRHWNALGIEKEVPKQSSDRSHG